MESAPVAEAIIHGPRALKTEKLLKSQTWPQKYIPQTSGQDQRSPGGTRTLWYPISVDTSRLRLRTQASPPPSAHTQHLTASAGDKCSHAINTKMVSGAKLEQQENSQRGRNVTNSC